MQRANLQALVVSGLILFATLLSLTLAVLR